ncbi:hypothetical protein ACFLVX_00465 [Chloroflexota bacterium]
MRLSKQEKETIFNFNQAEDTASIYTFSKEWMRYMETVLGWKPTTVRPYAREYEFPKSWIRKPQKPRRLTEAQKLMLTKRLVLKPILDEKTPYVVGIFGGNNGN